MILYWFVSNQRILAFKRIEFTTNKIQKFDKRKSVAVVRNIFLGTKAPCQKAPLLEVGGGGFVIKMCVTIHAVSQLTFIYSFSRE